MNTFAYPVLLDVAGPNFDSTFGGLIEDNILWLILLLVFFIVAAVLFAIIVISRKKKKNDNNYKTYIDENYDV